MIPRELVGLRFRILKSSNKSLEKLEGEVIDETKDTITAETNRGKKKIIKRQCVFCFEIDGKKATVEGKKITKTVEERMKEMSRK